MCKPYSSCALKLYRRIPIGLADCAEPGLERFSALGFRVLPAFAAGGSLDGVGRF